MEVTMGKKYKTVGNKDVRIYAVDGNGGYPIHGAIFDNGGWMQSLWTKDGFYSTRYRGDSDLVEVWEPKDKEPVWGWDTDYTTYRSLSFWDDKNKCVFNSIGKRTGPEYDNYAKVEHIEQWMLDAQAKLED